MHDDQLDVPLDLARALVDAQFPSWRDLPLRAVASAGTVNAIVRIGDRLAARFPLRPRDPADALRWLRAEADAARELHGRTRFATPEPVAIGEPGDGYPMPWSVQTWIPGVVATEADPGGSVGFAHDLADFILAVRDIDTRGRVFAGTGRGGRIADHDEWMQTCLRDSETLLDVPRLRRLWAELRELPPADYPDTMTHGDLMPGNVLVDGDRLAGVLDVGGLAPADRALDLLGAWHLLDAGPRRVLRDRLGCSELEWQRGRAWAVQQSLGLVWYYRHSNPAMSRIGRRTLARILADS